MCEKRFNPILCGERLHKVPANWEAIRKCNPFSGFIIVRLAAVIKRPDNDNLMEVAKESGLEGLMSILERYKLVKTRRVVRSLPAEKILTLEEDARKSEMPPLHSLTRYWRIDIRSRSEHAEEILKALNSLGEVDLAYRELIALDPQVNDADDQHAITRIISTPHPLGSTPAGPGARS